MARLVRERDEAREQQTAMSEVLRLISQSKFELQSVLQNIAKTAARLCRSDGAVIFQLKDGIYRFAAGYSLVPAFLQIEQRALISPGPGTLVGRAAMTRKVARIDDALADALYEKKEDAKVEGNRSMIGVPLLRDGEPVVVIGLGRRRLDPFGEREIELATTFAAHAVIAIENARLLGDLRESLQQQTATADVLKVISRSAFNLPAVLNALTESAAGLCAADLGLIFQQDGDVLRLVANFGVSREAERYWLEHPVPVGRGSTSGRALLEGRAIHIPDVLADPEYRATRYQELAGYRSTLSVPLLRDGTTIGVFGLGRREPNPFTEKQAELVTTFADQAVIAIENTRLLNELRQRTDDLSQRTTDLTEALEQQTATSEVLRVISSSPGDLKPVFDAMLANAARLCEAKFGALGLREGDAYRIVAIHNAPQAFADFMQREPLRPSPNVTLGRAIATKRVAQTADITIERPYLEGDPLVVAAVELGGYRTVLAVPMLKESEIIGLIVFVRQEVRPFNDKQIGLLQNFASQAVIAIENTRLLNELRQRTDELSRSVEELRALGEVSQAVNSTLQLETVLSTIVANAVQLSGTEAGAIYVFDDRQREFHLRATYGMDQDLIDALTQRRVGLDEPNVMQALAQGEPVQVADLREGARSAVSDVIQRAGFRALLVAPLVRGQEIVGMLVVRRRTLGAFPQNTVDLIKTFAAQSAVAIENARLFKNVETSLEDLRTTQDRLVQTQKLASLGQLTAGIAHEIKNPLNFVNNFSGVSAELIDELQENLGKVKADAKTLAEITELTNTLRDNLDKVVQHGKRADAIVKNMLLHSREGSGEHRFVDANALVEESLNLAYHGARAENQGFRINIERSLDPAAGKVDVFPQEITRALLNLISNGFYAATKRKRESSSDTYEPTLTAATKSLGDKVEIRIRDNGIGIPPEVRDKMFNPFFTTKPAGEGTGLGLSISHDIIVKQHGGSIEVDTHPGEFTEMRIILPRTAAFLPESRGRT